MATPGQLKRFVYLEDNVIVDDAGTPVVFNVPGAFLGLAANQTGMLNYAAEPGNLVMRTDSTPDFLWVCISTNTPPGNIANWQKLSTMLTTVASQAAMVAVTPQFAGQYVLRSDDGFKPYFWNGSDATNASNWVVGGGGGGSTVYRGVAANQAAMVALVAAVRGDYCYRSDRASVGNGFWQLVGTDPTVAANWFEESDFLGMVGNQAAMLALTPSRVGQYCIRSDRGFAQYTWNGTDATNIVNWTDYLAMLTSLGVYSTYDATTIERIAGLMSLNGGILNDTGKIYTRSAWQVRGGYTIDCVGITAAGTGTASVGTVNANRTKVNNANGLSAGNVGQYVYVHSWSGNGAPGYYMIGSWASNTDMELVVGGSYDAARGNPLIAGGTSNDTTGGFLIQSFTIKGNTLGENGAFNVSMRVRQTGGATKTGRLKTGILNNGTNLSIGTSTGTGMNFFGCDFFNIGAENVNDCSPMTGSTETGTVPGNIDTNNDQTFSIWYYPGVAATAFRVPVFALELRPYGV